MTARRRWGRVAGALAIGTGLWLGTATGARASLWEWTDGGGRVHKSRSLDDVPAEFRGGAVEIQEETVPSAPAGPTVPPPRSEAASPTRRSAQPAVTAPATPSGTDLSDPGAEAPTDRDGHDRAWWQSQVIETRQQINDLEAKVEHLRSEGIRSPLVRKEREARRELATAQEDLKKAKGKLQTDLPEAAAKAGAPASWLVVK